MLEKFFIDGRDFFSFMLKILPTVPVIFFGL